MPRPTIQQIRSAADFQKPYMWDVSILRQPAVANFDPVRWNRQMLSHDVPKRTGETSIITIRGHQIPDPGLYHTSGTIQLTFVETVDNVIKDNIGRWEEALYVKADVFRGMTADFRLTMMDNQENPIYAYDLLMCFLEDSNINTLDGSTSDPVQPSITLRYTDFRRTSF